MKNYHYEKGLHTLRLLLPEGGLVPAFNMIFHLLIKGCD